MALSAVRENNGAGFFSANSGTGVSAASVGELFDWLDAFSDEEEFKKAAFVPYSSVDFALFVGRAKDILSLRSGKLNDTFCASGSLLIYFVPLV